MLLSDTNLLTARKAHEAGAHEEALLPLVEPWDQVYLNPASVDLTLSSIIRIMSPAVAVIDVDNVGEHTERYSIEADGGFVLNPGAFILGATNEVITVPRTLVARVEGKSSLGRLGVAVHITAGFIDPGFKGSVTLEIANLNHIPIILRPNMRIAQVAFENLVTPAMHSYAEVGHYQDQPAGEPVESRYTT